MPQVSGGGARVSLFPGRTLSASRLATGWDGGRLSRQQGQDVRLSTSPTHRPWGALGQTASKENGVVEGTGERPLETD